MANKERKRKQDRRKLSSWWRDLRHSVARLSKLRAGARLSLSLGGFPSARTTQSFLRIACLPNSFRTHRKNRGLYSLDQRISELRDAAAVASRNFAPAHMHHHDLDVLIPLKKTKMANFGPSVCSGPSSRPRLTLFISSSLLHLLEPRKNQENVNDTTTMNNTKYFTHWHLGRIKKIETHKKPTCQSHDSL